MEIDNMIYEINSKKYFIDIKNFSFNLLEDPKQQLSIYDMWHTEFGYEFHFDLSTDKIILHEKNFNADTYDLINIPHLSTLVPNGIAKHYGLQIKDVMDKTDYEIMLDKRVFFDLRQSIGPTLKIEDKIFLVRYKSELLDPLVTDGTPITFNELDNYFNEKLNRFIFPYNPTTQKLEIFDLHKTTEIPPHLVLISIPHYDKLDPIRSALKKGISLGQVFPKTLLKTAIVAKKIPWEKTDFPFLFRENKERLEKEKREQTKKGRTHKM